MIIDTQKLVIYLDQNFLSNIAKIDHEEKSEQIKDQVQDISDVIKKGVDSEKFIVPKSWIHTTETSAVSDEALRNLIRRHQGYLGQISFNTLDIITDNQFTDALLGYAKGESIFEDDKWKIAFRENPDKPMKNFDVGINWGYSPKVGDVEAFDKIRRKGVDYKKQYEQEMQKTREFYKSQLRGRYGYGYFLNKHDIALDKAEKFIDSDAFEEIPNIEIFTKVWSKNLANSSREIKYSDQNDVSVLSLSLPYCDILATDKYMKYLAESLGLDDKYNTKVFSLKDNSLSEFESHLSRKLESMSPAYEASFSILCVTNGLNDKGKLGFISKLNSENFLDNLEIFIAAGEYNPSLSELEKAIQEQGHAALSARDRFEMIVFMSDFNSLKNPGLSTDKLIAKLPEHKKGAATAILGVDEIIKYLSSDVDLFTAIKSSIDREVDSVEELGISLIYY